MERVARGKISDKLDVLDAFRYISSNVATIKLTVFIEFVNFFGSVLRDINESDVQKDRLIHVVTRAGRMDLLTYLLSIGEDYSKMNDYGECTLHIAAEKGWTCIMYLLLQQDNVNVDLLSANRTTPLQYSIYSLHNAIALLLLEAGADPNKREGEDVPSPIELQATYEHSSFRTLDMLVSYGAELPPEGGRYSERYKHWVKNRDTTELEPIEDFEEK